MVRPRSSDEAARSCRQRVGCARLWVDQTANINGNYAISDEPLTEQEWVEKHVKD